MILNGDTLIVQSVATARQKLGFPISNTQLGFSSIVIPFLIDGGGAEITTGSKGWLPLPNNMTVNRWEVFADVSGDIEIDILKASYAGLPTFASIAGSDLPTLAAAQKNRSILLTGWDRYLLAGDWIEFEVLSIATITRATVVLFGNRT